jgi:hypothetical protein
MVARSGGEGEGFAAATVFAATRALSRTYLGE